MRFFERAEIKHAMAYLRLLDNPRDDTSFMRVVNFPARGIGARTLEQLQDAARGQQSALTDAVALVAGKAGANLASFVAKIDAMRDQSADLSLKQIVELVTKRKTGLIKGFKGKNGKAFDASLVLDEQFNVGFSFPEKKAKPKK